MTNASSLTLIRGKVLTFADNEQLNITSTTSLPDTTIQVVAQPWFLHGVNIGYNDFLVNFSGTPSSAWGGEGKVKSGSDIGYFLDNKQDANERPNENKNKSNRINW
ncbi:hypothetical protein [Campylobacter geochelonis]|uniref:hypothetical protein n=1 Tax=Campylobacter geochelonis TaxID=1780362 RepID=UPI00155D8E7B|nr:hypothetical protein [Campylobacter geochelonis]